MKNRALFPIVLTALAACGDDSYTIGGTVAGLTGSVVLTNGNNDDVTVPSSGEFVFPQTLKGGDHYWVAVLTQPATQACTVSNNIGVVDADDVTDIVVACAADTFVVGGAVTGLDGTLVLTNNGSDTLTVTADGRFRFSDGLAAGKTYQVAIQTQPEGQICTVQNAGGTASGDVTSIGITCSAKTVSVGVAVTGLVGTLVLQNNAGDNLSLSASGSFTFATAVTYGTTYDVTVLTQPASQTCTVTDGHAVATADVTTVSVSCVANVQVGGFVSGLSGTLQIANNGGPVRIITTNGQYAFAVAKGSSYHITIEQQPAGQTCMVTNAGPMTANGNLNNVAIGCSANPFTIGGSISGLTPGRTVTLQQNDADDLTRNATGPFTFTSPLADGATYDVTVLTQPLDETCTVTNGSGTVNQSSVTNIQVVCTVD